MSNELIALNSEQIRAVVQALPPNKRAAFSKAAKAASQHLRDSRKNYDKAYEIASAMVENWWHLGNELRRLGVSKGRKMKSGQGEISLSDLGINFDQSARCQKLAEQSIAEVREWLEEGRNAETYYLPSLRPASDKKAHVSNNSGEIEWYTPPEFIECARRALGSIDLDPCTSKLAQKYIKARKFYTQETDGLSKRWSGNVWMNPPYKSGLVGDFVSKLLRHFSDAEVKQAIVLVNNATDTQWFQELAEQANVICLVGGRLKFLDAAGEPANTPLQGQCFVYLGDRVAKFANEFSSLGICCEVIS